MARILCINPWIYDFAAYNTWIEPLGLLTVAGVLRAAGHEVALIDCLDRHHPDAPAPSLAARRLWLRAVPQGRAAQAARPGPRAAPLGALWPAG